MRRALLLTVLLGFLLTTGVPAEASHSWRDYHWARPSNPFTIELGDNVTGAWDSILATASSDWSRRRFLDTRIVPGNGCAASWGRIQVCNGYYGYNGYLGQAMLWAYGPHIIQGIAKMNDSYFSQSWYSSPTLKQHVMCQEIGHLLGLDHQPAGSDSCMNHSDRLWDPAAAHPNRHDYRELRFKYSHADSESTVAGSAGTTSGGQAASPHDLGRTVTVHRLSDGLTLVVFTFWA